MLEHQIIKTTRSLIETRITQPLIEDQIPVGLTRNPAGIAEHLMQVYLRLSGFSFGEEPLVALTSFTIYRPDRSRRIVFDTKLNCDDRVANMLHILGHIHLAPLPRRYTLVRPEQRDRTIDPDNLPVEEAADVWAMNFAEQLLIKAHPNNLLAEGLRAGSHRIAFLGKS